MNLNPYLKFIVALLGAAVTGASVYYSQAHWFPILTSVVTAILVYVTPNVTPAPAITKSDLNLAYPVLPEKSGDVWGEIK